MFWRPLKDCVTENITSMAQAGDQREKCCELYKWLQGLMHQKSIRREFVAALTRCGTGWRISKRIRPAGRWDKQGDRYRKTWSHVKDVRCHRCHDAIDVTVVVYPHRPFTILGNRARTQMHTINPQGKQREWLGFEMGEMGETWALGSMPEMVQ